MLAILAAMTIVTPTSCGTPDHRREVAPHNYIFFGEDRERITDTAFLSDPHIIGAELTYTWRELEPTADHYDLSAIRRDLAFLQQHGKRLFLQVQDVSFTERIVTPDYLRTDPAYHGGIARKYEAVAGDSAHFDGWVARRWDPAVRERFARLLRAIAGEFDGSIEGVVLPETAIGFEGATPPQGFSGEAYAEGVRENLSAARDAFQRSCVVIYANFMPHGSLPGSGHAFLREVYQHAESIGAGVGGPDILPYRPFQRSSSLPLIAQRPAGIIAAMAVQDGNLADRDPKTGHRITVHELYDSAVTTLRLNYIFWGTEEPYFTSDVLPFLRSLPDR